MINTEKCVARRLRQEILENFNHGKKSSIMEFMSEVGKEVNGVPFIPQKMCIKTARCT